MDVWSKERNERSGFAEKYIEKTLRKLFKNNSIMRKKYRNGRRGRNPYMWRATEQGKKAACKLWDDLEYDERTELARSV